MHNVKLIRKYRRRGEPICRVYEKGYRLIFSAAGAEMMDMAFPNMTHVNIILDYDSNKALLYPSETGLYKLTRPSKNRIRVNSVELCEFIGSNGATVKIGDDCIVLERMEEE